MGKYLSLKERTETSKSLSLKETIETGKFLFLETKNSIYKVRVGKGRWLWLCQQTEQLVGAGLALTG